MIDLQLTIPFFPSGDLVRGKCCGRQHPSLAQKSDAPMVSKFALQHASRVEALSQKMFEAFVQQDGGERLAKTGKLVRSNTLRTKTTRSAMATVLEARNNGADHGEHDPSKFRFWSKSVVKHALEKMFQDHHLEVPMLPGFDWGTWIKEQASLVQSLCKKASRNERGLQKIVKGPGPARMDEMQTLEWDVGQDCCFQTDPKGRNSFHQVLADLLSFCRVLVALRYIVGSHVLHGSGKFARLIHVNSKLEKAHQLFKTSLETR